MTTAQHSFLGGISGLAKPKKATPHSLHSIAEHDPQLAVTLLQTGSCAGGYVDTGGWEALNLEASFTEPEAGQTLEGSIQGLVEADLWLQQVSYTVRRPNAYRRNIFKAQSDEANKLLMIA